MSDRRPICLLTGVSSGIGWGLAHEWLERGWTVLGLSRTEPMDLVEHGAFHFQTADITDEDQVQEAMSGLLHDVGAVDVAVLNAGVAGYIGDLAEAPLHDLRRTMEVNVWANKRLIDILAGHAPGVRQIVAISSTAGLSGHRGWSGYAISKAALNMLVRLYAHELPECHLSALAPGAIESRMQEGLGQMEPDDRYRTLGALRALREGPGLPTPLAAAASILDAFEVVRSFPSGSFHDLRRLSAGS